MSITAIDSFARAAASAWPAGGDQLIETCRGALASLAKSDCAEPWLRQLHDEKPASRELYRSLDHGFVLLAHTEREGIYRPPHDHGRAWVVYAVQSGELEVGTYVNEAEPGARPMLVENGRSIIRPGEARAYRTGDIHDTRCLSDTALLFRFTERDLRHEDLVEGKLTRFVSRDGRWTTQS